ncbi:hypothetical protein BDZ89DRAFT_1164227 [Hymenopellis radicata]|nr:hypothetical protein BDZ89DRAFT_1164227 [Hymenopellis radicata]
MHFQPEASSSSAKQSKPILNKAGRAVLKEFYDNISYKPTRDQKLELLRNVIVAGNGHYDMVKLNAWFANHRQQTRKAESRDTVLPASSARPSFTAQTEAELAICFNETPHPSDELVAIWARGFNVSPPFVHDWIARRRERESQMGAGRLPTPNMTSPEPAYRTDEMEQRKSRQISLPAIETVNIQFPTPTTTPIVSPRSLPSSSSVRHASTEHLSELMDGDKVDKRKKPTHSERLLRAIGEGMDRADLPPLPWRPSGDAASSSSTAVRGALHGASSTDASSPLASPLFIPQQQAPRFISANDFHASFAPYEARMKSFMGKVGRGELEDKGWRSTAVPAHFRV